MLFYILDINITLELDLVDSFLFKEVGGVICGQSENHHWNYGRSCKQDLHEFEKKFQVIINGKPCDRIEDYKNFDCKQATKLIGMSEEKLDEKCIIY